MLDIIALVKWIVMNRFENSKLMSERPGVCIWLADSTVVDGVHRKEYKNLIIFNQEHMCFMNDLPDGDLFNGTIDVDYVDDHFKSTNCNAIDVVVI